MLTAIGCGVRVKRTRHITTHTHPLAPTHPDDLDRWIRSWQAWLDWVWSGTSVGVGPGLGLLVSLVLPFGGSRVVLGPCLTFFGSHPPRTQEVRQLGHGLAGNHPMDPRGLMIRGRLCGFAHLLLALPRTNVHGTAVQGAYARSVLSCLGPRGSMRDREYLVCSPGTPSR